MGGFFGGGFKGIGWEVWVSEEREKVGGFWGVFF
jgi:hypothetical protein